MLQAMRDKVMGVLGWLVIGLIIITFALFGLGSYLQNQSAVFVAKVNDVEIPPRELQQTYQDHRAQMEQMLGDAYSPALIDDRMLRQRALDSLVQRYLLLDAAHTGGFTISDELLAAAIQGTPVFQEDGKFSDDKYKRILRQRGEGPPQFEHNMRKMLLVQQITNGLTRTTFTTREELDNAYRLQNQTRDFSYLVVASEPFKAGVEVSDEQIQAYYDQQKDEFVVPERVRLAYIRLTAEDLSENIEIEEDVLTAFYEEKKESLLTQEQRRASHILIQVAADADEETVQKAESKTEDLLSKIREGADFSDLAKQHSDDPGSAAQGGDLGFFARGAMVPEFDETVFRMEAGNISEPVKTQFGFHIIKLVEIQGQEIPALEDVREDLVAELKERDISDLFYEQLELLTDVSYENPDSLDASADALGLEVQKTEWLNASGGPGIGRFPKVLAAAFSEDVLEAGNNSEPIEVGNNDIIVVRVEERQAAQPLPLDDVKERIVEILTEKQAREMARDKGEELLQQVKQGASLDELGKGGSFTFRKADATGRGSKEHDAEVIRKVFKMERPAEGAGIEKGFAMSSGDYVVVRLAKVSDAEPAGMPDNVRTQLESGYENMRGSLMITTMVEDLRNRADIVIPEESE